MKTLLGTCCTLCDPALRSARWLSNRTYKSKLDAATPRKQTLEDTVPPVAVITPKLEAPIETITLPGNVQAWFQAPIYAQVSGYVKMWYKDYGALVKKGDVLAEINAPALDAQYEQAKAYLQSERAKYALAALTAKRWVALRKNHAVSEQSISVQRSPRKSRIGERQGLGTECQKLRGAHSL